MALNRLVDNNAALPLTLGTLRVNEGFTSYGQTTLWAGSQSGIGLIVRQALQTQGADIQQWQAADGAVFGRVNSSGEFHHGLSGATARFGTVTPIGTAVLVLSPPAATYIGLVIRGFAAQTGDLQQWQNSAGTIIGKLDSAANLTLNAAGTGSIQLGDSTITKTSGSSFFFNSGGNFTQQVSISSGNLVMKPIAYAGNQSGGITMTDAGGNWTVGGFYLRSDGSGTPRFGFVPPQSANEILTIVGNQVGINNIVPNSSGSGGVAAQLAVSNFTANGVGLVVRGAASQTGNIQEWQNSSGTALASISSAGNITTSGLLNVTASAGDEGGEIRLAKATTNTTIDTAVNIDIYQNKLRFWESGGTNRGYYVDITSGGAGVSTNLSALTTGAMNYAQQQATKQSGISASGVVIVSKSFTTNGYPVQVMVTGDAENSAAGGWVQLQLFRDSTAIGKSIHVEASAASENVPYALQVIDTPAAGTYTYSLKTVSTVATGTMNFGETDGPVLTMIELSGPKGDTGTITTSNLTFGTVGLTATSGTSPWNGLAAATIDVDTTKVPLLTTSQTFTGLQTLQTSAAGNKGLIVKGSASQSANLQEWQNNSGTPLSYVDSAGNFRGGITGFQYRAFNEDSTTVKFANWFSSTADQFGQGQNWNELWFGAINSQSTRRIGFYLNLPNATANPGATNANMYITNTGVGINIASASVTSQLHVVSGATDRVGQIIRGAASQTANLQQWQDSSSTVLSAINAAGAFTGYLSATNTGRVGSIAYITPGASSQATWANYPVGLGTMIAASQAANGTPSDNFQYFFKVASRDVGSGWGGLSIDFSTGDLYVGNANDNTVYASWIKQASTYNANTFNNTQTIIPSATTNIGLIVKGRASQTANLQEWQDSAGTVLANISSAGDVTSRRFGLFGTANDSTQRGVVTVMSYTTGTPLIHLKNQSGSYANAIQHTDNANTIVGGRNANSQIFTGSTAPLTTAVGGATTAASGTGTTATLTTTSNHNLAVGDRITVAGVTPTGYNGTFIVTAAATNSVSYASTATGAQTVAGTVSVDNQVSITARSAATIGAIIRGAGSQSASLTEWQDSSAAIKAAVSNNGHIYTVDRVTAGSFNTGSLAQITSNITNAGNIGLAIRGAGSQTANLTEWQNSAGSVLASVSSAGTFTTTVSVLASRLRTSNTYVDITEENSGGRITFNKATAVASNPGAGIAKLYFRDGTNAGTLKLVVIAGASGAETTILDNIPQT